MISTIIHLSDLHIGYGDSLIKAKTITNNIIKKEDPGQTIIIITGDLVESGYSEKQIKQALNIVEQFLSAAFKVFIIPGNHDCGNGIINTKSIAYKFNKTFIGSDYKFPLVNIIDNLLLIGLDSNALEMNWHDRFFADGEIGQRQLSKLEKIIKKNEYAKYKKIIYMHHHPIELFPFHKLKDHKKLRNIIESRVDIVLYGHNHFGNDNSGKWKIPIMLDGGSSTGKRNFGRKVFQRKLDLKSMTYIKEEYHLIETN